MRTLTLLLLLAAACDNGKPTLPPPTSDLGSGLNTVERKVARPVPDVLKAASAAVQALKLRVDTEKGDALGGEISARRATDDKVVITVKSVDASNTSVSVRVAPGDRNMANTVHEQIAAQLGMPDASGDGESVTASYPQRLAACVSAAEKALRALKYEITERQGGEEGAELKARAEDSLPASFRFRKAADGQTEVTITCGASKGSPYRERRDQLRVEFEKVLTASKNN
jgi:hypothetical protein